MQTILPDGDVLNMVQEFTGQPDGALKLRLFKNQVVTSDTTQLNELVECDFPGYSPADISLMAIVDESVDGKAKTVSVLVEWTKTADEPLQDVWGSYFTLISPGQPEALVKATGWVRPRHMNQKGTVLSLEPQFPILSLD